MSKYSSSEYQKNKKSYYERQKRYKIKNRKKINERQRKHREDNPDQIKKYIKTRRKKIRQQYDEYMKDKICQECGYSDPRSLVWHHTDPKNKKNGVVQMMGKNNGWQTILKEIKKCICLCHNCHNIFHNHSEQS